MFKNKKKIIINTLVKIVSEKFEKVIPREKRKWGPYHHMDIIIDKLKEFVRKISFDCYYGTDTYSEYEIPSIPGGRIYMGELRDKELAISNGFRAKEVRVRFEYLENVAPVDLEKVRQTIKDGLDKSIR